MPTRILKRAARTAVVVALLMLGLAPTAHAATATLSWSANSESDLAGYVAFWGSTSGTYSSQSDVGPATSVSIPGLAEGNTYYFAVKAYDNSSNLSAFSAEVSLTVPVTAPSDTTPPSLVSVATPSATSVVLTFSEALDSVTAEDPGNYQIDGGAIAVLDAVLDGDGITVRLTTETHTLASFHTVDVAGVADLASPANLADDSASYQAEFGVQVGVIAPSFYDTAEVMAGDTYYVDESYTVLSVPAEYRNATWVLTANGDAGNTSTSRLRFTVDRDVVVFVGYDRRAGSPPDWLTQDFVPTGDGPATTNAASPFTMWARDFPAGEIDLGGNAAAGASGASSNYVVLVMSIDSAPAFGDSDGDGMPDAWETAMGLDPGTFDAHGDSDSDGLTNLQEWWIGSDPLTPEPAPSLSNTAPTVALDGSVVGIVGQEIQLDASSADDADGDPLTWQWHQTAGPAPVAVTGDDTDLAAFTPPVTGVYAFTVTVRDDQGGITVGTTDVEVYEDVLASTITALGANLVVSSGALTGAVLSIPLGAMDKPYGVAVGSTTLPKALPSGYTAVSEVVHFSPSDMTLDGMATIRVPYTRDPVVGFDNLALLRYDPESDAWITVSVSRNLGTSLEANLDNLGTFVVAQKASGTGGSAGAAASGGGCAATNGGAGDLGLILLLLAAAVLRARRGAGAMRSVLRRGATASGRSEMAPTENMQRKTRPHMTKMLPGLFALVLTMALLPQTAWAAAAPRVFFSDMTDGPITGWEGSASKGAAVSIWGINLGISRGTSTVTACGVTLNSGGDYAEWGATTNPTSARGFQRVTFWLKSGMTTGPGTISVTTADGTSNTIPFHCRSLGSTHIYFVDNSGSDSNNGLSTSAPWATVAHVMATAGEGDVIYFRSGLWNVEMSWNAVFDFWSTNHNNGTANKSITVASYPTEMAEIGDDTTSDTIRHHGSGCDVMNYWTFSKFKMRAADNITNWIGDCGSDLGVRFVANDMSTAISTGGKTILSTAGQASEDELWIVGNYIHHAGMACSPSCSSESFATIGTERAYGIYMAGYGHQKDVYIAYNEIAYNRHGRGIQLYGHLATDQLDYAHIYGNWIHDNGMTGIITTGGDGGSSYTFVSRLDFYNNIVSNNGDGAPAGEGDYPGALIGDTITYGGRGWTINFWNNTFYNNKGSAWQVSAEPGTTFEAKNNIVYDNDGSGYYSYRGSSSQSDCEASVCTGSSNNLFYGSGAGPSWNSNALDNVDPQFITANPTSNLDFQLKATSPARDAGVTVPVVANDFLTAPRPMSSAYDIGAYEYNTGDADTTPPATPVGVSVTVD